MGYSYSYPWGYKYQHYRYLGCPVHTPPKPESPITGHCMVHTFSIIPITPITEAPWPALPHLPTQPNNSTGEWETHHPASLVGRQGNTSWASLVIGTAGMMLVVCAARQPIIGLARSGEKGLDVPGTYCANIHICITRDTNTIWIFHVYHQHHTFSLRPQRT